MKTGYDQFFKKAQKVAEKKKIQFNLSSEDRGDSQYIAQELRARLKPKINKSKAKAKSKKIPWKLVGVSFVGLVITAICLWKADEIDKMARRVEIDFLGTAKAEEVKHEEKKVDSKTEEKKSEEAAVAKKEYTQDDIDHLSKLNERKRELDAREEELARTEQELAAQKAELEKKMNELEQTRRNISSVLEEKVQADDKKVDNLVQVYSNMKPQQAAKAFEEMDEGLAIEILGRMKKKNAAEIMNLVKSEKVKVLSEKYAGYKRN